MQLKVHVSLEEGNWPRSETMRSLVRLKAFWVPITLLDQLILALVISPRKAPGLLWMDSLCRSTAVTSLTILRSRERRRLPSRTSYLTTITQ